VTDIRRGHLLLDHGQFDQALQIATAALTEDPEDAAAWALLVETRFAQRAFEETVRDGRRALGVTPDDARIHLLIGIAHYQLRQHEDCATMLRRTIELAPDDAAAHGVLGAALAHLGDEPGARRETDLAITLAPERSELHRIRGQALLHLGYLYDAETSFRETLRLNPEDVDAHVNLGYIADRRGDRDQALEHNLNAARLDPGNAIATENVTTLGRAAIAGGWIAVFVGLQLARVNAAGLLLVPAVLGWWWWRRRRRFARLPAMAQQAILAHRRREGPGSLRAWLAAAFAAWIVFLGGASETIRGNVAAGIALMTAGAAVIAVSGRFSAKKWKHRQEGVEVPGSAGAWTVAAAIVCALSVLIVVAVADVDSKLWAVAFAAPLCGLVALIALLKRRRERATSPS
jgi:Flp pilus assembly protein TadD